MIESNLGTIIYFEITPRKTRWLFGGPTELPTVYIPLKIPEGTRLMWTIHPTNAQQVIMHFAHLNENFMLKKSWLSTNYRFEKTIIQSDRYRIGLSNKSLKNQWSEFQTLDVIRDTWPTVDFEKNPDTLYHRFIYFQGKLTDDYGIKSLKFFFQIRENDQANWQKLNVRNCIIPANKSSLNFDYIFRMDSLLLKPGAEIQYFFEVSDNDAPRGFKRSKSAKEMWIFPKKSMLIQQIDTQFSNLENQLEQTITKAQDLKSELSDAMKRAQLGKELNDQTRKEIAAKEKSLRKEIEQLKEEQQKWMGQQFSLQKPTENWIQKMENLQKMIDQLWNPAMEKEADGPPSNWQNQIEKKQISEKNRALELKRLEQFYKDLKKDQLLEKSIQELQNLSQKEMDLSQKTNMNEDQQQEIFSDFQEEKKNLEAVEQEKESEKEEMESLENDIQKELEKVKEAIQEKSDTKRKEGQKKVAEKMSKLAQKLASKREQEESTAMDLDLKKLRLLVDDLLKVSFEQEKLMKDFSKITELGPTLKNASQRQIRLSETAMVLEDSLLVLGKRLMPLSQKITRETGEMRIRMTEASKFMKERKWPMVMARQQQAMAATNQLAVMLSDLIQQIQNQQMQSKPGKKGKSKSKPQGSWADRQKKLNERTQSGQQKNQSAMSEEMMKIAQEQAKIRQELEQKLADLQNANEAQGLQKNLKDLIDAMEKNETDVVNKRIGKSLQERQELLLPKLLESEKALKEQGEDPKRESKNAMEKWRETVPPNLKPFLKKIQENKSLYDQVPVELLPVYQRKVLKYLEQFRK